MLLILAIPTNRAFQYYDNFLACDQQYDSTQSANANLIADS